MFTEDDGFYWHINRTRHATVVIELTYVIYSSSLLMEYQAKSAIFGGG